MGISNGLGALAGLGGFLTEHLTAEVNHAEVPQLQLLHFKGPNGWQMCFLIAMAIDLFGVAFFVIFASGEIQVAIC
jgi:ACS family sodium-dependent inorganic phosphate cotransporter-like MFS transporter 6/7/8